MNQDPKPFWLEKFAYFLIAIVMVAVCIAIVAVIAFLSMSMCSTFWQNTHF